MDVSENSGTPKSSILIGFSIINHPFWGTPIFGNTHISSAKMQHFNPPSILASGDFLLWLPKKATIEALLPVALETCQKEGETQQEEPVMLSLSYWEIWLGVWLGSKRVRFCHKKDVGRITVPHWNVLGGNFGFWRFEQCCGISVTCATLSPAVFWRDNIWRTKRKTLFDQEV